MPEFDVRPDFTLNEMARLIRRHPETLRRLARQNCLPGVYRVGGRWLFRAEAIAALRGESTPASGPANPLRQP